MFPGNVGNPLRVAIIGAGPAGFYTASSLLKQRGLAVEIDMFDMLPTPFGLVRTGVAPDHQKYKSVTRMYDEIASNPNYRFYGGVGYGTHIRLADLKLHYHQIVFATGAQSDRSMGIPGENLAGSHSATDFVAWYNGHPDFVDYKFDFSCECAAVVGLGNVALDVARVLCRTVEELAKTDMPDYAIDALRESRIKEVHILGRRGPAQAAFTTAEIREMREMADASVLVRKDEARLDDLSMAELEQSGDRVRRQNVKLIQDIAETSPEDRSRRLSMRFLVSPVELTGDAAGRVSAVKIVRNKLVASEDGSIRPRATAEFETLPAGLVFRSVGYMGVALAEIPHDDRSGTIKNEGGRVVDSDSSEHLTGLYTSGWSKRGPFGVIGTNKVDARDTVARMQEDLALDKVLNPKNPEIEAVAALVRERQPDFISYDDWRVIDQEERSRGNATGRPRVKFTRVEDMLKLLGR